MQTNKGNPLLLCNGFAMRKAKLSKDGLRQYWRCEKEKLGCPGRAISPLGSTILCQTVDHSGHGASPSEVQRRQALTAVKQAAKSNLAISSSTLVTMAKRTLSDAAIQSFPTDANVKKRINNARKPAKRATVDADLVVMRLPDEFKQTETRGRFLLHDSRDAEPDKSIILIFSSDRGLDFLRLYRDWSIDGTFFSCPKGFAQLFTINAFKEDSTLPAVFMLLPSKSEVVYRRAFDALFQHLPGVEPRSVMSDFEKAPTKVLKDKFPAAVFKFCLFHLSQNVFKSLQKKGLISLYDDSEVKILLRSFNALAFLPVQEVLIAFELLVAELEEKATAEVIAVDKIGRLREHFAYFKSTYVSRTVNDVAEDPLYPIADWNCFDSVLEKRPRTNNAMEGWHMEFNKKFPKRNPTLSGFIVRMKEEEHTTWQLALRNAANPADPLRNPRATHVTKSELQISRLVEDYAEVAPADRDQVRFVRHIQFHLAKFYNPTANIDDEQEEEPRADNEVVPVGVEEGADEMDENLD